MFADSSKLSFRPVCFSTNFSNFSSVSILRQYFMSSHCYEINYIKDYHINYKHKINYEKAGQIEIAISFYEISNFTKTYSACDKADCFIIFFDLENNESLRELNKILKFINDSCDKEKKIYLIKIYTNTEFLNNFSEDKVKTYFSNNNLENYFFLTVNMDSSDDLVRNFDSIIEDTIRDKFTSNKNLDMDKSNSKCLII